MKTIDCRNMACPMPVVMVKRALEESPGEELKVLLDDGPPRENVTRFAVNRGFTIEETPLDSGYAILISGSAGETLAIKKVKSGDSVMLIASDRLGDGPDELGRLLMKNFINTLTEVSETPDLMLFVNTGVFLTTEGSDVLEALEKLGNKGVEIASCGVCLDFFHRREKLKAGSITNMFIIAESLLKAGSAIRL
ncbi:MAG TPA: sulfurtransferase-like selenium metabolism protein YedF [Geobacteraceae bacterium]|nr:sulfurtransferase-like selenium metabolism protein YedF [Geobacteraceae bacterium]